MQTGRRVPGGSIEGGGCRILEGFLRGMDQIKIEELGEIQTHYHVHRTP